MERMQALFHRSVEAGLVMAPWIRGRWANDASGRERRERNATREGPRRQHVRWFPAALPGLLLLGVTVASASVSMSPARTRLSVLPGGHGNSTVTLKNEGGEAVQCSATLLDWTIEGGTASGVRYHPPGTQQRSAAPYLQVWPEELELAPGATAQVQLSVTLPAEASGSYFAALFLELRPQDQKAGGQGISIQTGLNYGHLVTVDSEARTRFEAELQSFEVSRPDDIRGLEIRARIYNSGDAGLRPEGSFAIVDAGGGLLGKVPLRTTFAQPGGTIRMTETWDGLLAPGRYQVIGTIDLGGGQFLTPELELEVVDRVEIGAVEVTGEAGRWRALARLENGGNITHVLSGTARVLGASGEAAFTAQLPEWTSLPGTSSEQGLELGELPPGQYEMRLRLWDDVTELEATQAFQVPSVPARTAVVP